MREFPVICSWPVEKGREVNGDHGPPAPRKTVHADSDVTTSRKAKDQDYDDIRQRQDKQDSPGQKYQDPGDKEQTTTTGLQDLDAQTSQDGKINDKVERSTTKGDIIPPASLSSLEYQRR